MQNPNANFARFIFAFALLFGVIWIVTRPFQPERSPQPSAQATAFIETRKDEAAHCRYLLGKARDDCWVKWQLKYTPMRPDALHFPDYTEQH
jgi:hypothetical protein